MTTKENDVTTKRVSFSEMRKEGWKISWTYQKALYYFLISLIVT